jgi:hypothetical protein
MEIQMDVRKLLALLIVAVAVVALTWGLRTKQVVSETPPVTEPLAKGSQLPTESQRIQALQEELAALRESASRPADVAAEVLPQSPQERMKMLREQANNALDDLDKALAIQRQREVEKLMAAGFAPDRIEWIRNRSNELRAQRTKEQFERLAQGLPPDAPQEAVPYYDPDAWLPSEIGDDEYTRYRVALGRPTGVAVTALPQGSPAVHAGLLLGDDIVHYGGARVFSVAELNALASRRNPGDSVLVDVRRKGQTMQVVVPGGPLPIGTKMPYLIVPRAY